MAHIIKNNGPPLMERENKGWKLGIREIALNYQYKKGAILLLLRQRCSAERYTRMIIIWLGFWILYYFIVSYKRGLTWGMSHGSCGPNIARWDDAELHIFSFPYKVNASSDSHLGGRSNLRTSMIAFSHLYVGTHTLVRHRLWLG